MTFSVSSKNYDVPFGQDFEARVDRPARPRGVVGPPVEEGGLTRDSLNRLRQALGLCPGQGLGGVGIHGHETSRGKGHRDVGLGEWPRPPPTNDRWVGRRVTKPAWDQAADGGFADLTVGVPLTAAAAGAPVGPPLRPASG